MSNNCRSAQAAQWVPEAKGWHEAFDVDKCIGGGDAVPQARLPSAQNMAASFGRVSAAERKASFLRDDDPEGSDEEGTGTETLSGLGINEKLRRVVQSRARKQVCRRNQ